jgi:hypothetical protein
MGAGQVQSAVLLGLRQVEVERLKKRKHTVT